MEADCVCVWESMEADCVCVCEEKMGVCVWAAALTLACLAEVVCPCATGLCGHSLHSFSEKCRFVVLARMSMEQVLMSIEQVFIRFVVLCHVLV